MIWNTLLFVFLWSFVAGWISSSTMWSWAWFLRYALKSQIIFENETLRAFSVTIDSAMGVRLGFWGKTGGIFILIFGDLIEGDWWDGDLFVNPAHFIFYFVFGKEVVNWAIAMIMFDKLINLLCCYQQKSMQNQSDPCDWEAELIYDIFLSAWYWVVSQLPDARPLSWFPSFSFLYPVGISSPCCSEKLLYLSLHLFFLVPASRLSFFFLFRDSPRMETSVAMI